MVVCVRIVGPVCWARPKDAPEGAAVQTGLETGDVDVADESAFGKGLAEGLIVYAVAVIRPDQDGQVVVSVFSRY